MNASPLMLRMAAAAAGLTFCLDTVLLSLIKSVCSRPCRKILFCATHVLSRAQGGLIEACLGAQMHLLPSLQMQTVVVV